MTKPGDTPAFPHPTRHTLRDGGVVEVTVPGMDLRDWFAGQIVGHVTADPTVGKTVTAKDAAAHLARLSYAIADAMIAERLK